jgi:hypothetical protein
MAPKEIYYLMFFVCREVKMQILKRITRLLAIAGLVLGFAACASAQVTWTLSDITFDNGNAATGYFVTDSTLTNVTSYSISVSGPATSQAFTASVFVATDLPTLVGFANSDFSEFVALYWASPLTNAGGVIPFVPGGGGFDCGAIGGCGTLLMGSGSTPELIGTIGTIGTTPEPATGGLLLLGLGLMMGKRIAKWRRRATETNQA